MSQTPSTMLAIGTPAPEFLLPDVISGDLVDIKTFSDRALLVVFSCNHCPYVLHILESFSEFAAGAQQQGLGVVMISANDVTNFPHDSPQKMAALAQHYGFEFPYLYDESQQVALAYRAACTPDFFLFDAEHRLVYRGQYDAARPGSEVPVSGEDMRAAVAALLASEAISETQIPSVGCNIKWRGGNEPDYF